MGTIDSRPTEERHFRMCVIDSWLHAPTHPFSLQNVPGMSVGTTVYRACPGWNCDEYQQKCVSVYILTIDGTPRLLGLLMAML